MKIPNYLICSSIVAIALLNTQPAWSAKLYKSVDQNGKISYQDSPPPVGSKLIKEEEISVSSDNSSSVETPPGLPVTVYTVDNCESCELLLSKLQKWGVSAQEQSLQDRAVQARILEISDSLSAPALFIGNKLISDMGLKNITTELQNAGHQIDTSKTNESVDSVVSK